MKTNKNTKRIVIMIATLLITITTLNANLVKPELSKQQYLNVHVDTKEQTFDEALLIGLQLLDKSCDTCGYGKIIIDFNGEKYTAIISLKAINKYNPKNDNYALFIRNNIKFI